jgi:AcrR family transcriptional regulator
MLPPVCSSAERFQPLYPNGSKPRTKALLLGRMVDVASETGYQHASVEMVLDGTGVARSTFYEHFIDKSQCFLVSLALLVDEFKLALDEVEAEPSLASLLETVVRRTVRDLPAARVLFAESLAAGPRSLVLRDSLVDYLDQRITETQRSERDLSELDVPARVLSGGILRLLAMRLGRPAPELDDLAQGLLTWAESYRVRPRSTTLRQELAAGPISSQALTAASLVEERIPPAGERMRRRELARAQRQRIAEAVLRCTYERGYEEVSVTEIAASANVSRKAFYKHFAEKTDAALEAVELVFQTAMVACAAGFFGEASWPDRAWAGGLGLLSFLTANPEGAHLAFVESPAIGRRATALAYQRLQAFAVFLEDGYRIRPEGEHLTRTVNEVLMATMYERAYEELRETKRADCLLQALPQFVYVILAPFMGPEAASDFVAGKVLEVEAQGEQTAG